MAEVQTFKRFPAIRCWIKHILDGFYDENERMLYSIFGKVKRIKIVTTLINKSEKINKREIDDQVHQEEEDESNLRIEFELDDGSGFIQAILWQANPERYKNFKKGDIVDVVGIVQPNKSISLETIRRVENPNYVLLRNAEIIEKIKKGEIQEIPQKREEQISTGFELEDLFEEDTISNAEDIKERIYSLIEKSSHNSDGIGFKDLKKLVKIPEDKLRTYLRDLIMESRIYESEQNNYQTY
jgi:hypothetical protein